MEMDPSIPLTRIEYPSFEGLVSINNLSVFDDRKKNKLFLVNRKPLF